MTENESLLRQLSKRRHYKKDSRFVFDLYTLCYDEHESVDTVELFTSIVSDASGNRAKQVRTRLFICTCPYNIKMHKNIHV